MVHIVVIVVAGALGALAGAPVGAEELEGRVVGVRDGDTLELLTTERRTVTVRLAGIDAPEIRQAYGQAAKRELSALAFGRDAHVNWKKQDDYGRTVGVVRIDGADINLRMIERGYAWHYKRYAPEQTAADRAAYAGAESDARVARRGLWADPDPVAPWAFRHGTRSGPGAGVVVGPNLAAHQRGVDSGRLGYATICPDRVRQAQQVPQIQQGEEG